MVNIKDYLMRKKNGIGIINMQLDQICLLLYYFYLSKLKINLIARTNLVKSK